MDHNIPELIARSTLRFDMPDHPDNNTRHSDHDIHTTIHNGCTALLTQIQTHGPNGNVPLNTPYFLAEHHPTDGWAHVRENDGTLTLHWAAGPTTIMSIDAHHIIGRAGKDTLIAAWKAQVDAMVTKFRNTP